MKSREDIAGLEYDWLACDEEGFVGHFSTAGSGDVPDQFLKNTDQYYNLISDIIRSDAICVAIEYPDVGDNCVNTWKMMAERGIYSFDAEYCTEEYRKAAVPEKPVKVDELSKYAQQLIKPIKIVNFSLRELSEICESKVNREFFGAKNISWI